MLGSLARTIITIDSIKNVISADFKRLLEDQVIVSRGYLAHIGIREIGEAVDVSIYLFSIIYIIGSSDGGSI